MQSPYSPGVSGSSPDATRTRPDRNVAFIDYKRDVQEGRNLDQVNSICLVLLCSMCVHLRLSSCRRLCVYNICLCKLTGICIECVDALMAGTTCPAPAPAPALAPAPAPAPVLCPLPCPTAGSIYLAVALHQHTMPGLFLCHLAQLL